MNEMKLAAQTTSLAHRPHANAALARRCCLLMLAASLMFAAFDVSIRAQAGRRRAPEVRAGGVPARSNVETLYLQAQRELNAGQHAAALATLDKIIATDPEFPDAHYARGQALARLGRAREAVESLRRVVEMSPANTRARRELALVLRRLGEHAAAIAELKESTRLEPTNARAYGELGATYLLLDEPGAGVNPALMGLLTGMIRQLNTEFEKTFLIIEHDMDLVARLCDPVIVMTGGSRLTEGAFENIRRDERVVNAYLGGAVANV